MCALHQCTSKQYVHWCIQNTKGLCWVNIDVCSRTETCNLIEDSRLVKGSRCVHSVSTQKYCSQRGPVGPKLGVPSYSMRRFGDLSYHEEEFAWHGIVQQQISACFNLPSSQCVLSSAYPDHLHGLVPRVQYSFAGDLCRKCPFSCMEWYFLRCASSD